MLRRALVFVVMVLFGMGIWVLNSQGENYPTRPIEILCPYSAGSSRYYDQISCRNSAKVLGTASRCY